jgi:hypothetical protein
MEHKYALMTFGIAGWAFPLEDDGSLKRKNHEEWLKTRRAIESRRAAQEAESSSSRAVQVITVPSRSDVLFGRGMRCQTHPGNIRLKLLMEKLFSKYEGSNRAQKMELAEAIVNHQVKSMGTRFLKQKQGGDLSWEVVDDKTVQKKVSHDFRTLRSINVGREDPTVKNLNITERTSADEGPQKRPRQV